MLARIRRITRSKGDVDSKMRYGNTVLDRTTFELETPKGSFKLANKEYQLMEMFISSPNRIFSSERIMEKIWGYDSDSEINVVWVYISYLRKKLTSLDSNVEIKASRNAGYSLVEKDD